MSDKKVDLLAVDPITIPGQKYALISVVSSQEGKDHALKIRGVFDDLESAQKHGKDLNTLDSQYDIMVAEMYKWLPIPPNKDDIENQVHQNEVLNSIITGHKEEQKRAKAFFEERKSEMMEGNRDPIDES
tara:strand:- start:6623 stop:7012 length:390 start_codon:yes stop_codon:yes gene_type:complete